MIKFPIAECQFCGSELFFRKTELKGVAHEYYYANGDYANEGENSGLYDELVYTPRKRWYCADCEKYLFTFGDDW
ncbi:MAG: hypothetical protein LBV67_06145 [Streptococcaceae bacterium]|jgi:hypothetical protein|nr:hypothetical protein [Streptococcaceae bacterium]